MDKQLKNPDNSDRKMRYFVFFTLIVAVLLTSFLVYALRTSPGQLKDFLTLTIPAYAVTALFILVSVSKPRRGDSGDHKNTSLFVRRLKSFIAGLMAAIFVLDVAAVISLYTFSLDKSFNKWRYGIPSAEEITEMRPVEINSAEPFRTIHISNIDAVKEARTILLPLRPYILESGKAHGIEPNAIATFILVNRMVKAKHPTYDLRTGLAQVLWDQGVSGQRNPKDLGPLADSSKFGGWIVQNLPSHIQLQDNAIDVFAGLVLGLSPTVGNMQIRADTVPLFENEKSVKANNLWARLDIDTSALTNRRINWMLLTNPRVDIEAGTAALKQSIDRIPKISTMDWYDIFSEASMNRYIDPHSQGDENHSVISLYGPYGLVQDLRVVYIPEANYPLFFIIAVESGVFDDKPGIITGATTPEQADYLHTLTSDKDPYIREAALRSLEVLADTKSVL